MIRAILFVMIHVYLIWMNRIFILRNNGEVKWSMRKTITYLVDFGEESGTDFDLDKIVDGVEGWNGCFQSSTWWTGDQAIWWGLRQCCRCRRPRSTMCTDIHLSPAIHRCYLHDPICCRIDDTHSLSLFDANNVCSALNCIESRLISGATFSQIVRVCHRCHSPDGIYEFINIIVINAWTEKMRYSSTVQRYQISTVIAILLFFGNLKVKMEYIECT